MSWSSLYHSRICDADDALACVQSGQRLFSTGNCSVPKVLLKALVDRARGLKDVELIQVLAFGDDSIVDPSLEGRLRINSLFISENVRAAVQAGRADFTPTHLSHAPRLFQDGSLPIDVALVHVSPPDEHGFCSLGVEVGVTKTAAETAGVVVAEVNPSMPRTLGNAFIHVSKIDHVVLVDYKLPEIRMAGDNGKISRQIGEQVATLVQDGATMQLGIGAIPDSVLSNLHDRSHLGIHTELFSDGVIDLYEAGVITNERKTLHRGRMIAGFLIGTQRLYDFVDNNPIVEMHPTEYVNDPVVIAQNDNMVAINSAIEVDLTGQVCADSIGSRLYSGTGGQLDFVRGASRSRGGKPIIALPSTVETRSGDRYSRIVPVLKPGAGVVTTRNDVHYVVTEFGVALLHGRTIRQRAQALIEIAHPDFRESLEEAAAELRYVI